LLLPAAADIALPNSLRPTYRWGTSRRRFYLAPSLA